MITLAPSIDSSDSGLQQRLAADGFAVARGADYRLGGLEDLWRRLVEDWDHLEVDRYMADGGQYRLRRYGRFFYRPATSELKRLPHATVFQPRYVNSFAGGIDRDFAPLRESTFENPFLLAMIRFDFSRFRVANEARLSDSWEVWIHQIRIETFDKAAVPPAPEGIHRDNHDFIAIHLVGRSNVSGGMNRVYDPSQKPLHSCFLGSALDTIYADDHRVMHAVDPIRPAHEAQPARRDVLIIDFDHRPKLDCPA